MTLDDKALDHLFLNARTQNGWLPTPVSDDQLRAIYRIMRSGPTSANSCPARILFIRTPEAKARLLPALKGSASRGAPQGELLSGSATASLVFRA